MATDTAVEVVMPQMGVSVSEGTVTKWLKAEGDAVAADEPLLEISTDKVDTEVPSPATGVVGQILVQEGETVDVGTRIATIATGDAAEAPVDFEPAAEPVLGQASEPAAEAPGEPVEPVATGTATSPEQPAEAAEEVPSAPDTAPAETVAQGGRGFVSPVVSRIAAEHGIDVSQVTGTGRNGRVTKRDILAFIEASAVEPAEHPAPAAAEQTPQLARPVPQAAPAEPEPAQGEQLEPLSVMRRSIAEHMRRSLETSAPVTTVFEVDMSKVVAMRERMKDAFAERHGVRLTYLAFIARAAIDTLASWPWINGEIRGETVVTRSFINLGVAVALDEGKGLIVPVIKNAEEKNLLGIARAIEDLADRARSKKLSPDEVHGGTFTITNPGGYGAIMGTPIINQPQSAILDVEAIVKRPVVVTDERGSDAIAIRPIMNLCLTYDHRLIDGAYAAPFMRDLRASLETWDEDAY